jgi:hypothetical protein
MAAQLGHDRLVVPPGRADEELEGLPMDPGLHGDRLAGLASQAAEEPADDQRGVGPLLESPEAGQVAGEECGEPVPAGAEGLEAQVGVGQEHPGVGVIEERHGGASHRNPPALSLTSGIEKQ